jgi:hypothetical protein
MLAASKKIVQLFIITALAILVVSLSGIALFSFPSQTASIENTLNIPAGPSTIVVSRSSPFGIIGASNGPATSYHWYAGGVYSGAAESAKLVTTTITVPKGTPESSQFYYVILSVWDNAKNPSYDQIGYSADYGAWGLTYSYTTGSCSDPTYHYNPDAKGLTAGKTYEFSISVASSGGVLLKAYSGKTLIYSNDVKNGATALAVSTTGNPCKDYGYTVYEEAYMPTKGEVPAFNFIFTANSWASSTKSTATSWKAFHISAPSPVKVSLSGSVCTITN